MSAMYSEREQYYRNSKTLSLHKSNEWVAVRISSVEAQKLNKSFKHPGDILPKREEEKSRGEGEKAAAKFCLVEFLAF